MSVREAADGECHYYLIKKNRYCRFQPKEGQQYCPEHACIMGIHNERKRVPCPLNPSHNCYQDDLDRHVKKCNVTKGQKATQEASYYIRGINKGQMRTQSAELHQDIKKVCVKDLTSAELAAMIARVNQLYDDHVEDVETAVFEHTCVREEYCQFDGDLSKALGEQTALRKELLQQASLVGQLGELGFLDDGHCFVEMGAGKGKLSHWIQKASKDCTSNSFLLVERSSVRYKMDSFHKQGGGESKFQRIKIDIEDLCLGRVELVNSENSVVVVGKHLCGGATDMGIRCAVETLASHNSLPDGPPTGTSSNSQALFTFDAEKLQKTFMKTHGSELSLSEERPPLRLGASESLNEVNRSLADSDKVFEGVSSSVDCADIPAGNSDVPDSASHINKVCKHSSEGVSVVLVEPDKLSRGDDVEEADNLSNSVSLHNHGFMKRDAVKDTKRKESSPADSKDGPEPVPKTLKLEGGECRQKLPKAVMIALCCHHNCTWDTYLGQSFMQSCGVTPQDFDLLTRLSSWATCAKVTARSTMNINNSKSSGQKKPAEQQQHGGMETAPEDQQQVMGDERKVKDHGADDLIHLEARSMRELLSVSEREDIGYKCKRLIDTGRLLYLRSKGMKCFLRKYVSEELTPENVVLIAHLPHLRSL